MDFSGSRLRVARARRGLSKVQLAERVNLSVRSISAYESDEWPPKSDHVELIARELHFPESFFFEPELNIPEPETASFRAMKSMTAPQRDMALAAGALCTQISAWIDRQFSLPPPGLPDLRGTQPEAAAAELRKAWGLGCKPIKNMVHLLESRGVRVFSLVQDSAKVDAFSLWQGSIPFVFLNTLKSGERGRFDAAHELGHLVLHRHGQPAGRIAEQEADEFASAILMPQETVMVNAPRFATLENLVALKSIWGVSVFALAVRLHRLGLLTEWHYRQLCVQLSERGYRKDEPKPMQRESSQVLDKVFAALKQEGTSKVDVAKAMHLHLADLEALVFGLVVVPSAGGHGSGTPSRRNLHLA